MKQKFDVDEFLKGAEFEVVLHGKSFFISDITEEIVAKFNDDSVKHKAIVKEILSCEDADLAGYGEIAMAAILKGITDHFFQSDLLGNLLNDSSKPEQSPTSST